MLRVRRVLCVWRVRRVWRVWCVRRVRCVQRRVCGVGGLCGVCLVAGINAGLFNQRIQSHYNNLHKVIIPSTQPTSLPQYFH